MAGPPNTFGYSRLSLPPEMGPELSHRDPEGLVQIWGGSMHQHGASWRGPHPGGISAETAGESTGLLLPEDVGDARPVVVDTGQGKEKI